MNHKPTNESADDSNQKALWQEHFAASEVNGSAECKSDSICNSHMCTQKLLQVNIKESNSGEVEPDCHNSDCEGEEFKTVECESVILAVRNYLECGKINVDSVVQKQSGTENVYIDKGIQITSGDLSNSFSSFIKSEKNLITICDIKSLKILGALTELMDQIYPKKKR